MVCRKKYSLSKWFLARKKPRNSRELRGKKEEKNELADQLQKMSHL